MWDRKAGMRTVTMRKKSQKRKVSTNQTQSHLEKIKMMMKSHPHFS